MAGVNSNIRTQICIAGGGPAGLMAGLLFARAGVETLVLEKHADFLRDFRGDTVHPSTLELFAQLGWLDELLELPHVRVDRISARVGGQFVQIADFRHLPVPAPFIAMMPQWDLLDFIARKAKAYPGFRLEMNREVTSLTKQSNGQISGVMLKNGNTVEADLIIAADGRGSVLRRAGELPMETLGAPMDVFWFRVEKAPGDDEETFGVFERGHIFILIDRGDYWQCAYVIGKGGGDAVKARELDDFKTEMIAYLPILEHGLAAIRSWDDIKLLSVSLDRLTRWHRPGLLAIGDAAHAMSPIGGVGINLAVQDAVAAANILAAPMSRGEPVEHLLEKVQQRRWKPTSRIQQLQKFAQNTLIAPILTGQSEVSKPPLPLRLINRAPLLQRIPARIIGLGFRREKIDSPDASAA
jgi:2-polyprenyl-6-methoxyphenol hydroxylase-like FAD-dependent oxidoreductase